MEKENEMVKEEIKALIKQIDSEQGNLSQYTDRQANAMAEKTRLEEVLAETGSQLTSMIQERENATSEKKHLESENQLIKKDIEDLEVAIQKLEQEKTNKDHKMKVINHKKSVKLTFK